MRVSYYVPLSGALAADHQWRKENNINLIKITDIDPSGYSEKQGYRISVFCNEADYLMIKLKYEVLLVVAT